MVGPQVSGDRAGVAALVEARVLEADRERADVPRRLDLAKGRGHARGIDAARKKDAERHVRAPVPRHRVAELDPRTARPSPRNPSSERTRCRRLPVSPNRERASLPAPGRAPAAACAATARSNRARERIHRRGSGPGSPESSARPMPGCASTALGSEPKARPPPGSAP